MAPNESHLNLVTCFLQNTIEVMQCHSVIRFYKTDFHLFAHAGVHSYHVVCCP